MPDVQQIAISALAAAVFLSVVTTVRADQTPDGVQDDARKQRREDARREAEVLVATEHVQEFVAVAKETSDSLATLATETSDFSKLRKDLLQNDDGKRIALDDASFLVFLRLTEDPPPNVDEVYAKKKAVDAILANVEATTKPSNAGTGFVPPPSMTDEVSIDKEWAIKERATIKAAQSALQGSIASGKDVSKAISLQQRLDAYNVAKVESLAKSREAGRLDKVPESEERVKAAAEIAELQRGQEEAERIIQRQQTEIAQEKLAADEEMRLAQEKNNREVSDLNKELAESEAHRAVENAQANATRDQGKADAEKIRLEQKCDDPAIKTLLSPFLGVGVWQPGDKPGTPWLHDRGPISLKALQAAGALQKTKKGLSSLYLIGNATNVSWAHMNHPDSERPKWGYPSNMQNLTQSDWEEIQKAQDLLIELGQTMVEKQMLSP